MMRRRLAYVAPGSARGSSGSVRVQVRSTNTTGTFCNYSDLLAVGYL